MTDLRAAAEMALEALLTCDVDYDYDENPYNTFDAKDVSEAIEALRQALAQPEPVTHAVIAGVLFDFMGWLTSRQKRLVLSASDEASPAVKVIEEFAKMRGLSLDDAKVKDWQEALVAARELKDELYAQEMAQPTPLQLGTISITVNKRLEADIDLLWQVNSADIEALEDARATLETIRKTAPITLNPMIYQSLSLIYTALSIGQHDAFQRIIDKARGQA